MQENPKRRNTELAGGHDDRLATIRGGLGGRLRLACQLSFIHSFDMHLSSTTQGQVLWRRFRPRPEAML